jgi:hypothetical protein
LKKIEAENGVITTQQLAMIGDLQTENGLLDKQLGDVNNIVQAESRHGVELDKNIAKETSVSNIVDLRLNLRNQELALAKAKGEISEAEFERQTTEIIKEKLSTEQQVLAELQNQGAAEDKVIAQKQKIIALQIQIANKQKAITSATEQTAAAEPTERRGARRGGVSIKQRQKESAAIIGQARQELNDQIREETKARARAFLQAEDEAEKRKKFADKLKKSFDNAVKAVANFQKQLKENVVAFTNRSLESIEQLIKPTLTAGEKIVEGLEAIGTNLAAFEAEQRENFNKTLEEAQLREAEADAQARIATREVGKLFAEIIIDENKDIQRSRDELLKGTGVTIDRLTRELVLPAKLGKEALEKLAKNLERVRGIRDFSDKLNALQKDNLDLSKLEQQIRGKNFIITQRGAKITKEQLERDRKNLDQRTRWFKREQRIQNEKNQALALIGESVKGLMGDFIISEQNLSIVEKVFIKKLNSLGEIFELQEKITIDNLSLQKKIQAEEQKRFVESKEQEKLLVGQAEFAKKLNKLEATAFVLRGIIDESKNILDVQEALFNIEDMAEFKDLSSEAQEQIKGLFEPLKKAGFTVESIKILFDEVVGEVDVLNKQLQESGALQENQTILTQKQADKINQIKEVLIEQAEASKDRIDANTSINELLGEQIKRTQTLEERRENLAEVDKIITELEEGQTDNLDKINAKHTKQLESILVQKRTLNDMLETQKEIIQKLELGTEQRKKDIEEIRTQIEEQKNLVEATEEGTDERANEEKKLIDLQKREKDLVETQKESTKEIEDQKEELVDLGKEKVKNDERIELSAAAQKEERKKANKAIIDQTLSASNLLDKEKGITKQLKAMNQAFKDGDLETGFKGIANVVGGIASGMDLAEQSVKNIGGIIGDFAGGDVVSGLESAGELQKTVGKVLLTAGGPLAIAGAALLAGGVITGVVSKIIGRIKGEEETATDKAEEREKVQASIRNNLQQQLEFINEMAETGDKRFDTAQERFAIAQKELKNLIAQSKEMSKLNQLTEAELIKRKQVLETQKSQTQSDLDRANKLLEDSSRKERKAFLESMGVDVGIKNTEKLLEDFVNNLEADIQNADTEIFDIEAINEANDAMQEFFDEFRSRTREIRDFRVELLLKFPELQEASGFFDEFGKDLNAILADIKIDAIEDMQDSFSEFLTRTRVVFDETTGRVTGTFEETIDLLSLTDEEIIEMIADYAELNNLTEEQQANAMAFLDILDEEKARREEIDEDTKDSFDDEIRLIRARQKNAELQAETEEERIAIRKQADLDVIAVLEMQLEFLLSIEHTELEVLDIQNQILDLKQKGNEEDNKSNKALIEAVRNHQRLLELVRDQQEGVAPTAEQQAALQTSRQSIANELRASGASEEEIEEFLATLPAFAEGGIVENTGLSLVSAGELIIPKNMVKDFTNQIALMGDVIRSTDFGSGFINPIAAGTDDLTKAISSIILEKEAMQILQNISINVGDITIPINNATADAGEIASEVKATLQNTLIDSVNRGIQENKIDLRQ